MSSHSFHRSPDAPATLEEALARIDARAQQANDSFERVRDFSTALESVRGHGEADGVMVIVNHLGLLLEVSFPDSLIGHTPSSLSRATTTGLRVALADALRQVAKHAHRTWGDDPLVDQVVGEARERFAAVTR